MKTTVKCEYCQSVVDARQRYCPSCGSPLPEAQHQSPSVDQQPANRRTRSVVPLLLLLVLLGASWLSFSLINMTDAGQNGGGFSAALETIEEDPTDVDSYKIVITNYLEQNRTDMAYNYAFLLVKQAPDEETGRWCMEIFQNYGLEIEAVRFALLSDALSGESFFFPLVADTTLDTLMPTSPLRQALELRLGKSASLITLADLQDITYLSIGSEDPLSGGRTVTIGYDPTGTDVGAVTFQVEGGNLNNGLGLFCFQGLLRLEVHENQVGTEELLLPNLIALTTSSGTLTDLTDLSSLTNLEELTILNSPLTSLAGVDALPNLKSLNLTNTDLTDLSVLPALKGLTSLTLVDNDGLTSVASLTQMSQLTRLSLTGQAITDLSPIAGLTGLKELSVCDTGVRSTAFLTNLTGLTSLTFTSNDEVEQVPELGGLTNLTHLVLESDETFESQSDMAALTALTSLELLSTKDLSYLLPLSNLEELTLYFTRSETDLSPLAGLTKLRRLDLRGETSFYAIYDTSLVGLGGLQNLPLEGLDLGGHTVYGPLDPVLTISTLQELDLSEVDAEGTNFSLLSGLQELRRLNLSGFRDMVDTPPGPGDLYWSYEAGPASTFVEPLVGLTRLEELNLSNCGVTDITPLSQLTSLTWLDLSGNSISNLTPLSGLVGLTYLNLSGNPIPDYGPVEDRDGLILIR